MTDLDEKLDRMCADGRITAGDADEVRTFASFLAAVGPVNDRASRTPEERARFRDAWADHYPDDYGKALADHGRVQRVSTGHTGTVKGVVINGHAYVKWDGGGAHAVSLDDLAPLAKP